MDKLIDNPEKLKSQLRGINPWKENDIKLSSKRKTQFEIEDIISKSNIPVRHSIRKIDLYKKDEWTKTFHFLNDKVKDGIFYAFLGNRGGGKTQMGVELLKDYARVMQLNSLYCTAFDLFLCLRSCFNSKSTFSEIEVIDRYKKPSFLIIDEIHERSDSEFENRTLTHILDNRYANMKNTIVIGNFQTSELSQRLGASISSRLLETGGVIEFNWESFRK